MKNSKLKPILLTAALIATAGCQKEDKSSIAPTNARSQAFIDSIVPHHEMALMMADEAIAKAIHPSLKEMAAKMKVDQTQEIAKFKEVRKTLYGSDLTPNPMPMVEMPAGEGFDKMFIHLMMDHHQDAIDQSTMANNSGLVHPLDSLADNIIQAQKREQTMMRDSLKAWYNEEHKIGDGSHM